MTEYREHLPAEKYKPGAWVKAFWFVFVRAGAALELLIQERVPGDGDAVV